MILGNNPTRSSSSQPIISVIVPVYNTELQLEQCLYSIIYQRFTPPVSRNAIEVIVVNDCSPDNSEEIINRFVRDYPEVIREVRPTQNVGLGAARDLGIENARGEYIMFVDSDDFVSPDFVRLALDTIEATEADLVEFGYVYSRSRKVLSNNRDDKGYQVFKRDGNNLRIESSEPDSETINLVATTDYQNAIKRIDNISWNKIYRRSIIADNELKFRKRFMEDTCFVYRYILNCKRIVNVTAPTYCYWQNLNSLMHTISPEKLGLMIKNNDDIIEIFRSAHFDNSFIGDKIKSMMVGLLKRMEGIDRNGRLDVFSDYKADNGEFSNACAGIYNLMAQNYMRFCLYRMKTLGFKYMIKSKIKRILHKV